MRRRQRPADETRVSSTVGDAFVKGRAVPVEGAALVTTVVLEGYDQRARTLSVPPGSFWRVRLGEGVSAGDGAAFRRDLLEAGAAAVKVVPAPRSRVVVQPERERPDAGAREVVLALVAAANTEDRAALLARCEESMAAEGL